MLEAVITFLREKFEIDQLNLLGHSMGGIIIGLLSPENITKTILVASPTFSPYKRMKKYFSKREGTIIDENGESRIARSDGSVSILNKEFWTEMKEVDPLSLYKALSSKTNMTYVRALEDHVVTDGDYVSLKDDIDIDYIEIHGDHDFTGKDRENWLHKMIELIL